MPSVKVVFQRGAEVGEETLSGNRVGYRVENNPARCTVWANEERKSEQNEKNSRTIVVFDPISVHLSD
jgi:phage terminase large subunit GpA-like protein